MKEVTLALDAGFGDVKICMNGKFYKEISAIAQVSQDTSVSDENFIEHGGKKFYVFSSATKLPSSKQVNITNFDELKFATPLFIKAVERNQDIKVNKLCLGLSLAMTERSQEYKEYVSEHTGIPLENIYLLPQGLGSKVAYQRYNLDPNDTSRINDTRSKNYLGIDIGFNTIDVFQVIDGKTSTNIVQGFEHQGIIKVAEKIANLVKSTTTRIIDIPVCKEIISTGVMNWRGNTYDFKKELDEVLEEYFIELFKFIEDQFSASIDKMDNVLLVGGGAALYNKVKNRSALSEYMDSKYGFEYVLIPVTPEFYNVLGYYAYAQSK